MGVKGKTNNPAGRPKGAKQVYSEQIKMIIGKHFMDIKEGNTCELEKILNELSVEKENKINLKDKITIAYDYFKMIAAPARDTGEVQEEERIKSALFNKFLNKENS